MRIRSSIGGLVAFVMLLMLASSHANRALVVVKPELADQYGRLPLSFEPNLGQRDSRVKFVSRGHGYVLSLTPTAAILALRESQHASRMQDPHRKHLASMPTKIATKSLCIELVGARPDARIEGVDRLPGTVNYFIGKDRHRWRTNIPTYARVRYRNVYPGIDLIYYGTDQHQLEYDFVVTPKANPSSIALRFDGAKRRSLDTNGDLHLLLAGGGEVIHHAPSIYQKRDGRRQPVRGKWVLQGNDRARFALENYDRSRAVYIDPTLAYSTYLGGSGDGDGEGDSGAAIAIDSTGAAYVIGTSFSSDFPTGGAPPASSSHAEGANFPSVFIAKFNSTGTALLYSTFLSGSLGAMGSGIAVVKSGVAYVTGSTSSPDFPTTQGTVQGSLMGRTAGFVAALSAEGTDLLYSTYLSGSVSDHAAAIAVSPDGLAYVTGDTESSDFPTTGGAFQTANKAFSNNGANVFVTKLSADGTTLMYSTLLGGSLGDEGDAIAVDSLGFAYVTGTASSIDFPTTFGAFQTTNKAQAGGSNAFATKLKADGSGLVYSTYLGGSVTDSGSGIAVDSNGFAYVTGDTFSPDFPTSIGAFQTTNNALGIDRNNVFATKLATDGTALSYSTYIGGSSGESGNAIAVDANGSVVIVGQTFSVDFPITSNALQTALAGGGGAFVTQLTPDGTQLRYSTYLSGNVSDQAFGVAFDPSSGSAFITGETASTDFPVTVDAFQSINNAAGNSADNAFVSRIDFGSPSPSSSPTSTASGSSTLTPTATAPTPTATPTPSNLASKTPTATASATTTVASTSSPTATASATPSSRATATATSTPTASATAVATATATASAAASQTPAATPTASSMETPIPTATSTPTHTPTPMSTANSLLSAAPAAINFGKVDATGTSKAKKVTLTNKSNVAAVISSVTTAAPFSISGATDACTGETIAPRKKCSFEVLFTPTMPIDSSGGSIEVTYNGVSPSVSLAGSGIAVALKAPKSKSLGAVKSGQAGKTGTIVISNPTPIAVTIGTAAVSGPNQASFAITGDSCSATSLAAKGKCSIAVQLTPTLDASGGQSATLLLPFTYGANDGTVTVTLTGQVK